MCPSLYAPRNLQETPIVHEALYFGDFVLHSQALVTRLMPHAGFEVTQLSLTSLMSSANIGEAVGL